jgi:hypothetical protein
MSKEIESIASALFDKIRSRFATVTLGDESAKSESDPTKARFFNFNYTSESGAKFGTVTISLIDETSLKVYFGQNISGDMDREQRKEWYEFLRNLRQFAKRNLLTFDTRDINKTNLELQDIKQQAKADDKFTTDEIQVTESKLYGTPGRPYNSFADKGNTKILIRHADKVNDEVRGSRARQIQEIFLETERGERFLLPHKNLHGAYAMAEHLNAGGDIRDERAEHIDGLVSEMAAMRHFVRSTKHRQFEDQETADMTRAAVHHYDQIKRTLRRMRGARGYRSYFETFSPAENPLEDIDVAALKERFVKKVYDDRFEDALPYVYRAYKQQKESLGNYGTELEEWANSLSEMQEPAEEATLENLMSRPLFASRAVEYLKQIFPDSGPMDDLEEIINQRIDGQGPDSDCRDIVKVWVANHCPEQEFEVGEANAEDARTNFPPQVSPGQAHINDTTGANGMDGISVSPVVKEDSLDFIRSLAGIRK